VTIATDAGEMQVAVVLGETFGGGDEERVEILTGVREGDRIILPKLEP
jgi:hypothetical protein